MLVRRRRSLPLKRLFDLDAQAPRHGLVRLPRDWEDHFAQHILSNRQGLKVAVIGDDMSKVNIDADLVREGGANLSRTDE
ncbi:hypothetical protein BRAO375_2150003 [Bradyrhizobium sp. ORS 375]|nr:hypothetical protein BRAO375_2150003 [Bradyrhizobium sp. ORS 375]